MYLYADQNPVRKHWGIQFETYCKYSYSLKYCKARYQQDYFIQNVSDKHPGDY